MAKSYRIIEGGIKESFRTDEQRKIIPVRVFSYMVGAHGPFTYQVDARDFDPVAVDAMLEKAAQDLLKLLGP